MTSGPDPGLRVVTLVPAATEIVHALGMGEALVGRSHECDHPPGVEAHPALTAPKYDPDGTSYAIDERVKALLQEGLSVYRVDAALLDRLRPDVIVTQEQCEVCAASLADVEAAVCELVGSSPRIVSLAPGGLADVWADFLRVAAALGVPERGREVVEVLEREMLRVAERVAARPATTGGRPRVAVVEWLDPLMAAGNWVPELVERAGGHPLFGESGAHSPWLAWDDLVVADPDVIVVTPCGFTVDRTLAEIDAITSRSGWADLRAVREGRAWVADGHGLFNRPGPRLLETLELLARMVRPDVFPGETPDGPTCRRLAAPG